MCYRDVQYTLRSVLHVVSFHVHRYVRTRRMLGMFLHLHVEVGLNVANSLLKMSVSRLGFVTF